MINEKLRFFKKVLLDSCVFIAGVDKNSQDFDVCHQLLEFALDNNITLSMPAHAWFEIWCNMKRLEKVDKTFRGQPIKGFWNYPIELFYLDESFMKKYGNTELRYIKAGDHIFLVLAKVNKYPIITIDKKMKDVAEDEGISVYNPKQFIVAYEQSVSI